MDRKWYADLANKVVGLNIAQTLIFVYSLSDDSRLADYRKFDWYVFGALVGGTLLCIIIVYGCHYVYKRLPVQNPEEDQFTHWVVVARIIIIGLYGFGSAGFFSYLAWCAPLKAIYGQCM